MGPRELTSYEIYQLQKFGDILPDSDNEPEEIEEDNCFNSDEPEDIFSEY